MKVSIIPWRLFWDAFDKQSPADLHSVKTMGLC
jgi:hypothetical protein